MAGPFDLTGQNIENTYQRILQTPDGVNVYDGTGSAFVLTATVNTSSLVTTSSFNAFTASINTFTSSYNTGSFSGSFTGSFNGTSSWAQSASQALTASYYQETDPIFTAKSASLATTGSNTFKGNQNISGSVSITGSLVVNDGTYDIIDTVNKILRDNGGTSAVDWQNKTLTGTRTTVDWGNNILKDNSDNLSIDWENRVLYANDGTTPHIDWSNPSYIQLGSITESPITNVLGIDGGGKIYYTASSAIGGGGSTTNPGGSNTQIQYNNSNIFGGVPTLTYDGTTLRATGSFTGSFVGSLIGTASWANNVSTASRLNADSTSIFAASSNRMVITASNGIIMNAGNVGLDLQSKMSVTGDILPGPPITNNTSSWSLGSPTAAWKDLYVSNGSVYFISGSTTASISFINGAIDFGSSPVIIPTGSTIPYTSTSSFLGNGVSSSFNINHGFNTRNLHITVYDSASGDIVYPDLKHLNVNTSSITFANPPSSNQYVVYISQ